MRDKEIVSFSPQEKEAFDEVLDRGPIGHLLKDRNISEIMINGPEKVYVERDGHIQLTDVRFKNTDQLFLAIERLLDHVGKTVTESEPFVDARLPDGSRVNVIIPPLSLDGPIVTIRRTLTQFSLNDLIGLGTLTDEAANFLINCVKAKVNIVISGGTTTGKTTILDTISQYIPQEERVITIETTAELKLKREHLIRLEAKPPNAEGKGEITIRDLVKNALRMRPDRIILGEARGGEALDMIQAMHTGHEGFITVIHANSPQDALERLQTLMMISGVDIPFYACRAQIASAIDLIIQLIRFPDGSRKVSNIAHVAGVDMDRFVTEELFIFEIEETSPDGKIVGKMTPTGVVPRFTNKFKKYNIITAMCLFFLLTGCDKIDNALNRLKGKNPKAVNLQTQPPLPQPPVDESKVLARINNRVITIDEFKKNFEAAPGGYDSVKLDDKRKFLDDTVRIELLYQEALARGLERDEDVKNMLEEAKRQILAGQLIRLEFEKVVVETNDIEDFYNIYKTEFVEPEELRLRQIVVDEEEKARAILVELLKGADFAQLAKERSKANNAKDGGLIDSVKKGEIFPQLDGVAFSLDTGAISSIVKGPDGYYIVKLESRIPQKQKSLTAVWDEIKGGLLIIKRNKALEDKITQLKNQAAKLDIYEEKL